MWTEHATMIDEVMRAGATFEAVIFSVGGGGLLCGVAEGLARNGLKDTPVIAVETKGTTSFSVAVKAGKVVELPAITGVVTSLGARKVSERAFQIGQTRPIETVVVDHRAAVEACIRCLNDHRILVETACGAALAMAYSHPDLLA